MPRSIIEAMMTGLPVVATDIRGSREEVCHGSTGYLVSVGSVEELRKTVIAYEPIWAIGSGLIPSFEEINKIHYPDMRSFPNRPRNR